MEYHPQMALIQVSDILITYPDILINLWNILILQLPNQLLKGVAAPTTRNSPPRHSRRRRRSRRSRGRRRNRNFDAMVGFFEGQQGAWQGAITKGKPMEKLWENGGFIRKTHRKMVIEWGFDMFNGLVYTREDLRNHGIFR